MPLSLVVAIDAATEKNLLATSGSLPVRVSGPWGCVRNTATAIRRYEATA